MPVPRTTDEGDQIGLASIASESIMVMIRGEHVVIYPEQEPEKFLKWLHVAYSGSRLRAGKAE